MNRKRYPIKEKLVFKKWRSKSYSAFNSLGKEIKILTLATAYFSIFGFLQTLAQVKTDTINKIINLNEVLISARRSPSLYSETGRVINIISHQEIKDMPVQDINELLRYAAGVDIRNRGPLGIQSDVSIRGGSFNQAMILLNGINVTDPQTGHFNLNIPVDLQSIERIEILEGPGARVYGPGTFSGAINIVTSSFKEKSFTAKAVAGQHCYYDIGSTTTLVSKKFNNYIAGNFNSSNGYIENTDFKNFNLFYNGRLNIKNDFVDLQAGYLDKAFGANSFYTPKFPDQFEQTQTTFISARASLGRKIKITPALYWRRNQDRFELFRDEAPEWYAGHNYHMTNVYGGNINIMIPWKLGKTSLGTEIRRETIWSNNIGNETGETKPVPGEPCREFDRYFSRTNNSFFIEHAYSSEKLSFSAGLLINNNSSLQDKTRLFPGMDVSYRIHNGMKLYASINNSLRLPTFTEMFYNGPVNTGNRKLKSEEAVTCEGGVNYNNPVFTSNISVFYRRSWNLIDWGRMEGEEKYMTRNLADMNSWGIELTSNVDLQKLFNDQTFFQNMKFSYNYVAQDKQSMSGYESVYVMDYLKHKLYLNIENRIISHLSSNLNVTFQDRNGSYIEFIEDNNSYSEVPTEYEPFVTVDLRLSLTIRKYMLYTDINNVFNKKYYDIGNVQQPGIWVMGGINIKLN